MSNKEAKLLLQEIYGNCCMMLGYELSERTVNYHHILKKCKGGKASVENGALLLQDIHQWLHNEIERTDKGLYNLINECLDLYKQVLDKNIHELINQYQEECMTEYRRVLK